MNQVSEAILRTLVYADIFDYPLTEKEIFRFLISNFQFSIFNFQKELSRLPAKIASKSGFYFLTSREKIIKIRKRRERWSRDKFKIASKVAQWLRLIPTIKMVAVTGALAMNNADRNDDIDLLVVTAQNRLWLTRLLTVFLVELVAQRRRPGDPPVGGQVRDKICLNMFLDEDRLAVPKNEQDLFSAHEVVQLRPIWGKDGTYNKFIKQNKWLKHYLANWKP